MKLKNIIFFLFLVLIFYSCGNDILKSKWTSKPINIDGKLDDWEGELYFNDDQKTAIGVKNDNRFLYLCLTTKDRNKAMPLLMQGFTVWLEPEEGKTLGIRYPIAKDNNLMMEEMNRQRNFQNAGPENERKKEFDFAKFEEFHFEFQVINEDEYPLYQFYISDTTDYQIKMSYDRGQLVYELKIPIGENHYKYTSLPVNSGDKVTLLFESGEFEKPSSGKMGMSGMGMNNGGHMQGGGRGGMNGGRGDGNPGGSKRPSFDPIDFELDVILAEQK